MTKTKISCFQEGQEDMLEMIEKNMRGGISMISNRYAKANNKYMKNFNPDEPSSFIMYLDANNLYGWAMSQYLPTGNYKWCWEVLENGKMKPTYWFVEWLKHNNVEMINSIYQKTETDFIFGENLDYFDGFQLESFVEALLKIEACGIKHKSAKINEEYNYEGWILDVDLDIPENLHDYFNDYPLAPENRLGEYSPIMQEKYKFIHDGQVPKSTVPKLIPNLYNKKNYVLHYRNLQLYLKLGMKLSKVNKIISFNQEPFLEKYIDFNTKQRTVTKNDYEKDLFKLMNNSVFGKTMENVSKRIDVKLMTNEAKFVKQCSLPYFKDFRIFSDGLAAVEMNKTQVLYNRPMIVGFCILELSKVLMYDFHYNTMKKTYNDNISLLFTDTDSLCYHIKTEDFFEDIKNNLDNYDTSDYPKEHPSFSTQNKKVIGKFKDEANGKPIIEFCGHRAKMYSFLTEEKGKSVAKGVKKNKIKQLKMEQYKAALFGTTKEELNQKVSFNLLRSKNHQMNSIRVTKSSLSAIDDKRYIKNDNISSFAHGHFEINKI